MRENVMENYQEVFRFIPTPCVLLDGNDFSILDSNEAFFKATGISREDSAGKSISDVFGVFTIEDTLEPDVVSTSLEKLKHSREKQQIDVLQHTCAVSGTETYWSLKIVPLQDSLEVLTSILVSIEDISERILLEKKQGELEAEQLDTNSKRKEAELAVSVKTEELKWNEAKFRSLVQEGTDLIGILDYTGTYTFASESSRRIFNLPPEAFVGTNAFECIHPEDKDAVHEVFYSLKPGENRRLPNYRAMDAEGKWRWIESMAVNLMEEPAVNGIVTHSRDISTLVAQADEIEQITKRLKLSNNRYKIAMRVSNEMIYDWDIPADRVDRGRGFERIYGFELSDATADHHFWFKQIDPADQERAKATLQKALLEKESWIEEYDIIKANGELAHVQDRAVIIRDETGKPVRLVGAVQDVTSSRKLLKDIRKQNEILKEIAWEQSHVVRAPLVRLKGLLDFLGQDQFDVMSNQEVLEHIHSTADELDNIVRRIVQRTEQVA